MRRISPPPLPAAPRFSRSGWLALVLSLGAHVLLGVLLSRLAPPSPSPASPLEIDTCVLTLDEDRPPAPRASPTPLVTSESPPGPAFNPIILPEEPIAAVPPVGGGFGARSTLSEPPPETPSTGTGTGAGTPGTAMFFQVSAPGGSIVYVIDRSGSMGLNGGLAVAKRELLASLEQLPESARFQVLFYNRAADLLRLDGRTELLPVSGITRQAAARFLSGLWAAGSTNHLEALKCALQLAPDVIFLVTDADDLTPEQVRLVTAWNNGRTAICAIELSTRDCKGSASPLYQLAQNNRGTYRFVPLAPSE